MRMTAYNVPIQFVHPTMKKSEQCLHSRYQRGRCKHLHQNLRSLKELEESSVEDLGQDRCEELVHQSLVRDYQSDYGSPDGRSEIAQ